MRELKVDGNLQIILDSMSEGIIIIDANYRIIFGNKAYCRFISMDPEKLIGVELRKIRPTAKLPEVIKSGTDLLHVERNENGEYYFVNMYPIKFEC